MRLLLIRHGIAEDTEAFAATGEDDAVRPLTKPGKRKMRRVARGLHSQVRQITVLGSSPLTRAMQTAQIVADEYDGVAVVQVAPLAPRKPLNALLAWLQTQPTDETVALVGHDPDLSIFASWLLTGLQEALIVFKKGGVCLLALDGDIKAGHAKLRWSLTPGQLRALRGH